MSNYCKLIYKRRFLENNFDQLKQSEHMLIVKQGKLSSKVKKAKVVDRKTACILIEQYEQAVSFNQDSQRMYSPVRKAASNIERW